MLRNILYWRSMVQTVVERNIQAVVEGVTCYHDFCDEHETWALSHLDSGKDCPSTPPKNGGRSCCTSSCFSVPPVLTSSYHHEEREDPSFTKGNYAAIWSATSWGHAAVTAVLGGELFVWEAGDAVMLLESEEQAGGSPPGRRARGGRAGGAGVAAGGRAEFGRQFRFDLADVTAPLLTIGK